jgi:hypothetical protein
VPIIVAVITGTFTLVSTVIVPRIENPGPIDLTEKPTPVPTRSATPTPPVTLAGNSLSVRTDKNSYGFGDYVKITGSVEKPAPEKTVRIDVYDPDGKVFEPYDRSVPGYVPQTDIQVKPNNKGQFSYRFPTDIFLTQAINGTYVIEGTYDNVTRNTTIKIR